MRLKATTPPSVGTLISLLSANRGETLTVTADLSPALVQQVMLTSFWPEAVSPSMIVKDEPTKRIRASGIITSFIREPIKGKKLLDAGCTDGYCVSEAKQKGSLAFGYSLTGATGENITTELAKVEADGPYDIIMCYDVLDHIVDDTTRNNFLATIKKCLKPGGKVYMRCHPFTSRHGCHNYYKFNKAYAQLFLTQEQLAQYDPLPIVKIVKPLVTYKQWFAESGFRIVDEQLRRVNMEDFFNTLTEPLMNVLADNPFVKDTQTLNSVLSIQFADFVLQTS